MPNDILADISISKISYLSGEEFCVKLIFDVTPVALTEEIDVWVYLQKVERGRNIFAFAFGDMFSCIGNNLEVKRKLPQEFSCGLYLINEITLRLSENGIPTKQHRVVFDPVFFVVQTTLENPLTKPTLAHMIAKAEAERHAYINHEIQTDKSRQTGSQKKRFSVLVFGEGCLLHSHQQLEGYVIIPLGLGMSHRRMHEIVNSTLLDLNLEPLRFDLEMEKRFESDTPAFLVLYQAVVAVNNNDAMDYCRSHAALVFELISLDRGQKPHEFACLVFDLDSTQRWLKYQQPSYKGYLNPDFDPVSTANLIERHVPKLQTNPFLQLLIKTYADATAEDNLGFALLRFWSVMELLADKYVPKGIELKNPDGSQIVNAKGKPEKTDSKHGRVYYYISTYVNYNQTIGYSLEGVQKQYSIGPYSSHLNPEFTQLPEQFSLWDMIRAGYAVRNAIAHEGQFDLTKAALGNVYDRLATKLIESGTRDPHRCIRRLAELSLKRELDKT
ncbi:MAG: hypothetical protein WC856_05135 [Methylococcaceae bacterium]|jgi:hypothetical protein